MSLKSVLRILSLCALVGCAAQAIGQNYPSKPLRFAIGFGPGGGTDLVSRLLAQKLSERLGQPVVPELKTGATGLIASDFVAKSPPDGSALILLTGGHPAVSAVRKNLPHDPVRDLAMVSLVVTYPIVITVNAQSRFKTIDDFLRQAKANPGRVSFASAGLGSGQHLIGEWINIEAGIELLHVPFKGNGPAMTELLAGRVDMMIDTMTSAYPNIKAGRTRALAVTTREPVAALPGVPSISTLLPTVELSSFAGLATSPGTPPTIIARLNKEVREILDEPDMRQKLKDLGGEPMPSTPEEMRDRIVAEIARWNRVIDSRNIERQ